MQTAPYLAAKAEREAAAHRVIVARRQAVPDVTASVGVRRLEVDKANAIIAGITVPFPLFDRNRGTLPPPVRSYAARKRGQMLPC